MGKSLVLIIRNEVGTFQSQVLPDRDEVQRGEVTCPRSHSRT